MVVRIVERSSLHDQETLVDQMDAASIQEPTRIRAFLSSTEGQRRRFAAHLTKDEDHEALCGLLLRESVLQLLSGSRSSAIQTIRQALRALGPVTHTAQRALVLTQLAACHEAVGDLRAAVRTARQAEASLVAEMRDETPQMLAVRAQLIFLLDRAEIRDPMAAARFSRTLEGLQRLATDDLSKAGLERLTQVFVTSSRAPHWALCYCQRWA